MFGLIQNWRLVMGSQPLGASEASAGTVLIASTFPPGRLPMGSCNARGPLGDGLPSLSMTEGTPAPPNGVFFPATA